MAKLTAKAFQAELAALAASLRRQIESQIHNSHVTIGLSTGAAAAAPGHAHRQDGQTTN